MATNSTPPSSPHLNTGIDGAQDVSRDVSGQFGGDDLHRYRAWNGNTPFSSPQLGSIEAAGPMDDRDQGHAPQVNYLPLTLPVRTAPLAFGSIHMMGGAASGSGDGREALGRHERGVSAVEGHVIAMATHPPLIDLSGLGDSDSDVGGGNEVSPVVMELGCGGMWQEKSREEDPYLCREEEEESAHREDESAHASTCHEIIQSPKLEIKRQLYNTFHGTMQYARNKGDIDLHRMISRSVEHLPEAPPAPNSARCSPNPTLSANPETLQTLRPCSQKCCKQGGATGADT